MRNKIKCIFLYLILIFNISLVENTRNDVTEVEYQLIMEDSETYENSIKRPDTEREMTIEEENELKSGICKVVFNEANTLLSSAVYKRNNRALNTMEKNMYLFILGESLKDYAVELAAAIKKADIELAREELESINSAVQEHCNVEDLKEIYDTIVKIPDEYDGLDNGTNWEKFVVIQLDRVYDYVNTHFNMFKKELLRLKNTKSYYERKNFFRKRKGKAVIMTIFYEWLENEVCKPKRIGESAIRDKLNEHLKWVVSQKEDGNK